MMFISKWKGIRWLAIFILIALMVLFLLYLKIRLTGNVSLEVDVGDGGILISFWDWLKQVVF